MGNPKAVAVSASQAPAGQPAAARPARTEDAESGPALNPNRQAGRADRWSNDLQGTV